MAKARWSTLLLLVCAALAVSLPGCAPPTLHGTLKVVLDAATKDDTAAMRACKALGAPRSTLQALDEVVRAWEAKAKEADASGKEKREMEKARRGLALARGDLEAELAGAARGLFGSLSVMGEGKCSEEDVRDQVAGKGVSASCKGAVEVALKGPEGLGAVFAKAGLDAGAVLEDPIKAMSFADTSYALVLGATYVADKADELAVELASNTGFFQGAAQLAGRRAATEVLAALFNLLIDELADGQAIQKAAVARAACSLYTRGESRPAVTTSLLRRAILRFAVPEKTAGAAPESAAASMCAAASKADAFGKDVCEEMWALVGGAEIRIREPGAEGKQVEPRAAKWADVREPRLLSLAVEKDRGAGGAQKKVEQALSACRDCTLETLRGELGAAASAQRRAAEKILAAISGMDARFEAQARLIEEVSAQARRERDERGRLHTQLVTLAQKLAACADERSRVIAARREVARTRLRQEVSCGKASAESKPETISVGGLDVLFDRAMICDPARPFVLTVSTEKLFGKCDDVSGGDAFEAMAELIPEARPREVLLLGHTDAWPIESESCKKKHASNLMLSIARAKAAKAALVKHRASLETIVEADGVGEHEPLECSKWGIPKGMECDARSRRVTLRIQSAELTFDASCASP